MSLNVIMPDARGRSGAALSALVLVVALGVASCHLTDGALDEANQLNRGAGEDIREVEKIVRENKGKEAEVSRALDAGDVLLARRLMDEAVNAIDRGLEKGQSASDRLARAAGLDVDPTIREYLSLRARWIGKSMEAVRELRRGIVAFRDAAGVGDKAAAAKAQAGYRQTSVSFEKLMAEAGNLERQADEIARRNPDKIKPGS